MGRRLGSARDGRTRREAGLRIRIAGGTAAVVSLMFALSAGAAQAVTINFDDLNAPGRDNGVGLPVDSQYSGQGVTFNDLDAFDYS